MTVASPCLKICQIDPFSDLCLGCMRTRDEISRWTAMTDDQHLAVIAACKKRGEIFDAAFS